jgi:hypothetical protein
MNAHVREMIKDALESDGVQVNPLTLFSITRNIENCFI